MRNRPHRGHPQTTSQKWEQNAPRKPEDFRSEPPLVAVRAHEEHVLLLRADPDPVLRVIAAALQARAACRWAEVSFLRGVPLRGGAIAGSVHNTKSPNSGLHTFPFDLLLDDPWPGGCPPFRRHKGHFGIRATAAGSASCRKGSSSMGRGSRPLTPAMDPAGGDPPQALKPFPALSVFWPPRARWGPRQVALSRAQGELPLGATPARLALEGVVGGPRGGGHDPRGGGGGGGRLTSHPALVRLSGACCLPPPPPEEGLPSGPVCASAS